MLYIVKFDCNYDTNRISQVSATPGDFIVSPGYPNYYPKGVFCELVVVLPSYIDDTVLSFQSLDMEDLYIGECYFDYLKIN